MSDRGVSLWLGNDQVELETREVDRSRCEAFAISLDLEVRKKAAYEELVVLEDMRIAVRGRLVENGARPRLTGDAASPIIIAVPF
jgi:hypothetical protein